MRPFNIVAIHGVAQHFYDQENYYKRWEKRLNDVAPDLNIRVFGIHWESSGSATYDIAGMLADGVYRRNQLAIVEEQAKALLPIADVIMAHSLGCSLIMPLLERLNMDSPRVFGLGGPMGHPLWGKALSIAGLKWTDVPIYPKALHFWNDDDPVASLLGLYLRPAGWYSQRIAIAGPAEGAAEHCDEDYLTHPLVLRRLRGAYESVARSPGRYL